MAESVDALDSKSGEKISRAGSSPALGTKKVYAYNLNKIYPVVGIFYYQNYYL